ncbi:MAG TPA: DMT family transporter [Candidatus Paceibacterota bacterium]|nr:DMT family transporter [Candidatus Paceibacterota bacterium]
MKSWGPYLVLFAAMLWATDAPFRLHLTQGLSSNFIVLGEHFVDVIFVLPILVMGFATLRKLSWREWGSVAVIAIGGSALASIAFTQAFHYVNPSVAILLQKLQPLIAISLAALILKEPLRPKFWLWAIVALFGAYLISFPGLVPQSYPGETFNPNVMGVALALVAAFFWGASTVFGKFVLRKVDFKMMTALRFCTAFVFLLLLNWQQGSFPAAGQFTGTDALFIVIIAIASGVVSLFIYYKGLETTQASVATLAELGFPMAAIFVNWLFIPNSALVPMQLVGVAVLLFAVWGLAGYNREAAVV